MEDGTDVTRFGCVKLNDDGRITDFEEKPMASDATTISCGIYVIRRRQLIELLERCAAEDRYDLVNDILVRYKNLKEFMLISWTATGAISLLWTPIIRQIWISSNLR